MKKFKFRYVIEFEGKSLAPGKTTLTERDIDLLLANFLESLRIYDTRDEPLRIKSIKQKAKDITK